MSKRHSIDIRDMADSDTDLDGALALSRAVNWPYRKDDWRVAASLGHGVLAEADGRIVGSALWWPYGERLATFGMIIVSPAMQGQGIGRILMDSLLRQSGDRTVLLNSTEEGLALYRHHGFEAVGTVHQHQAWTPADSAANVPVASVRPFRPSDEAAIIDLDRHASGVDRTCLITRFMAIGETVLCEADGTLTGFAICRRFGHGYAIGPVIGQSSQDARSLIGYFLREKAGNFLRVDIPGDSRLGEWLEGLGLPEVGRVKTMVRGTRPPQTGPGRILALASQSLG